MLGRVVVSWVHHGHGCVSLRVCRVYGYGYGYGSCVGGGRDGDGDGDVGPGSGCGSENACVGVDCSLDGGNRENWGCLPPLERE